jgi:hypothetical protein
MSQCQARITVGIASGWMAEELRFDFLGQTDFCLLYSFHTSSSGYPASYTMDIFTLFFGGGFKVASVMLSTHLHLALRLQMAKLHYTIYLHGMVLYYRIQGITLLFNHVTFK